MENKVLTKSKIVIALYVIAIIGFAYVCYLTGLTISQDKQTAESYGMTGVGLIIFRDVLLNVIQPLMVSILTFAAGYILNEVRALNPAYYASAEELAAAKAAKVAAKAAKAAQKKAAKATPAAVEAAEEAEEAVEEEAPVEEAKEEAEEEAKEEAAE